MSELARLEHAGRLLVVYQSLGDTGLRIIWDTYGDEALPHVEAAS